MDGKISERNIRKLTRAGRRAIAQVPNGPGGFFFFDKWL